MILTNLVNGVVLAVVLILGNCSEPAVSGVLPVVFVTEDERFSPQDPVQLESGSDEAGQPHVMMQMTAKDAAAFGKFTARHIGQAVALRVCDKVVAAPVVQGAIAGGLVVVSGGDAHGMMSGFMANGCP